MPNYTGMAFGRWTVTSQVGFASAHRYVTARCVCGTVKRVYVGNLLNGKSQSCGCLRDEIASLHTRTHGKRQAPEYTIWADMKKRCYNPSSKSFKHYGARGITVCDRWRDDFAAFDADMGPRPSRAHSIERINNDGPYTPDNCKWATKTEQMRNTTRSHYLTYNGEKKTLAEWSAQLGWNHLVILKRLQRGWTIEQAISTPKR